MKPPIIYTSNSIIPDASTPLPKLPAPCRCCRRRTDAFLFRRREGNLFGPGGTWTTPCSTAPKKEKKEKRNGTHPLRNPIIGLSTCNDSFMLDVINPTTPEQLV
eukprot:TRINITY_DN15361_c0_g2_i2.p1 TRINITY_DN15361_c0_g2~~TRINITY_DN15361_c0_g2_i2.p1  ORF type:complete len:104 (-),score=1.78 TRINITY_DN15361_c0_g2_i2:679-990(-)